jgi:hypothetical protein
MVFVCIAIVAGWSLWGTPPMDFEDMVDRLSAVHRAAASPYAIAALVVSTVLFLGMRTLSARSARTARPDDTTTSAKDDITEDESPGLRLPTINKKSGAPTSTSMSSTRASTSTSTPSANVRRRVLQQTSIFNAGSAEICEVTIDSFVADMDCVISRATSMNPRSCICVVFARERLDMNTVVCVVSTRQPECRNISSKSICDDMESSLCDIWNFDDGVRGASQIEHASIQQDGFDVAATLRMRSPRQKLNYEDVQFLINYFSVDVHSRT